MLEHEQISRSNRSVANMVLIQLRRLQTLSKRCIGRLLLFFFFKEYGALAVQTRV